jgi:hypothetical protein
LKRRGGVVRVVASFSPAAAAPPPFHPPPSHPSPPPPPPPDRTPNSAGGPGATLSPAQVRPCSAFVATSHDDRLSYRFISCRIIYLIITLSQRSPAPVCPAVTSHDHQVMITLCHIVLRCIVWYDYMSLPEGPARLSPAPVCPRPWSTVTWLIKSSPCTLCMTNHSVVQLYHAPIGFLNY